MKLSDFGTVRDSPPTSEDDEVVYVGSFAEPGNVDSPDRIAMLIFSDKSVMDARLSPYEPTNPNDPVSPQRVSQCAGGEPYEPGILHAFPDDVPLQPEPPPVGGEGGNGGDEKPEQIQPAPNKPVPEMTINIESFSNTNPTRARVSPVEFVELHEGDQLTFTSTSGSCVELDGKTFGIADLRTSDNSFAVDVDLSAVDTTGVTAIADVVSGV